MEDGKNKLSPALSPLTKGDKGGCVFHGNFTTPLPPFLRGIFYHPETRVNKMKISIRLNYTMLAGFSLRLSNLLLKDNVKI